MMGNEELRYDIIEDTKPATYIPRVFYFRFFPYPIRIDMGMTYIGFLVLFGVLPLTMIPEMYRYLFMPILLTFFVFKVKLNNQPIWIYIPKKVDHLIFMNRTAVGGDFKLESSGKTDHISDDITVYHPKYKLKKK